MSYLVTFPDGYSMLFRDPAEVERAKERWAHHMPTIRDLDQEARDREEMLTMLMEHDIGCAQRTDPCGDCRACRLQALLKRLGRLP